MNPLKKSRIIAEKLGLNTWKYQLCERINDIDAKIEIQINF